MTQLEYDIQKAEQAIGRLIAEIDRQERLLRGARAWRDTYGLDTEAGRAARQAFEADIAAKEKTLEVFKRLLEKEYERVRQLMRRQEV